MKLIFASVYLNETIFSNLLIFELFLENYMLLTWLLCSFQLIFIVSNCHKYYNNRAHVRTTPISE